MVVVVVEVVVPGECNVSQGRVVVSHRRTCRARKWEQWQLPFT